MRSTSIACASAIQRPSMLRRRPTSIDARPRQTAATSGEGEPETRAARAGRARRPVVRRAVHAGGRRRRVLCRMPGRCEGAGKVVRVDPCPALSTIGCGRAPQDLALRHDSSGRGPGSGPGGAGALEVRAVRVALRVRRGVRACRRTGARLTARRFRSCRGYQARRLKLPSERKNARAYGISGRSTGRVEMKVPQLRS